MKRFILLLLIGLIPFTVFAQRSAAPASSSSSNSSVSEHKFNVTFVGTADKAMIYINGQRWGKGYLNLPTRIPLIRGTYNIEAQSPNQGTIKQTVVVNGDREVNLSFQPLSARVSINSSVTPLRLYIDGQWVGAQGASLNFPYVTELSIGRHSIKATSPGYRDFEQTFDVRSPLTININMQPANAQVNIQYSNQSLKVYLDGQRMGYRFEVLPGNHRLRIEFGDMSTEQSYNFAAGQTYTIVPNLSFSIQ
ncbi:PEGA domain-containing protein [Spirochaeta cellobiosiphila]|uniref:PEGA domain-containing protein n=1 Tax=Spirochaeta cellobiosiphila TaxID=504483 RepID=UPI0003F68408|nr:PEGA domain-containing protein [Spirochaeta cellobiosiphila]